MAKKAIREVKTTDYRYTGEKRTNIPPAKIAAEGKVPNVPKVRYEYSPHLPPTLQFDASGKSDKLPTLLAEAGRRSLTQPEQKMLAEALRTQQPWLEWTGKREQHERGYIEVDPVALHIHERISTQAIVHAARREDIQRDLFADPEQPYAQAVQFYRHDMKWTNRLILGDSLQVMSSLARRETLAGKVQMIYVDPPYGIRFGANFQPMIGQTEVSDRDKDLTREPETVRAFRDTWTLGVHSYLTYLRDRLVAAHELLAEAGSIFVQISDANIHRVRCVLDEVFGRDNYITQIQFKKTGGASSSGLATVCDYLLWYGKNKDSTRIQKLYHQLDINDFDTQFYDRVLTPDGELRPLTKDEKRNLRLIPSDCVLVARNPIVSPGTSKNSSSPLEFEGEMVPCPEGRHWSQDPEGMQRLIRVGRICRKGKTLRFIKPATDSQLAPFTNTWMDLGSGGFVGEKKRFIVKTDRRVLERCVLLTTHPGDLVLDPTCGGGTTAIVCEEWGRRWIAIDTSRIAISITRQRILAEGQFPYFKLKSELDGPKAGFEYSTARRIEPSEIAQNRSLDDICDRYQPSLESALADCNSALTEVSVAIRDSLKRKVTAGSAGGAEPSLRELKRWDLPIDRFEHWSVPFDSDPEWPEPLRDAVDRYRQVSRTRSEAINEAIGRNAGEEQLINDPVVVKGVVRVSGPFTVEGVRPEELSLGEEGLFDSTPIEFDDEEPEYVQDEQNLQSYMSTMIQHLRNDGVSFMDNSQRRFAWLEALFDGTSGSVLHAEGVWAGVDDERRVAVTFGPQSGPVTALQVEEAIRESRHYDELVIAGFSFDAEATAVVAEQTHPKLRIHEAFIRPDLNSAMEGLLKDTPRSQLFTVFGQPEIVLEQTKTGWVCTLKGVDIYNPIENTVRSSGADKVAAWFLDSDFDGRCFCITQAFFPEQNAWEGIAKALGSSADLDAFERFKGTTSLPFQQGKYGRIAVKVIDPRGNEVMAIRKF